jgi:hypothetical protein
MENRMKMIVTLALALMPVTTRAEPNPDVLIELWRSYRVAMETSDPDTAAFLAERRATTLAEMDRCEGGMAHPNCWNTLLAKDIYLLQDAYGTTGSEVALVGPFPIDCPEGDVSFVALLPVTPRIAILDTDAGLQALEQLPDNEFRYEGEADGGLLQFGWQGDFASLSRDGGPEILCSVIVGDD